MKLGLIKEAEKYENEEREREFSRLKISEDETIRCNELLKSLESVRMDRGQRLDGSLFRITILRGYKLVKNEIMEITRFGC